MDIENLDMEWKESWADKYLKTIAAFYNTKGGRMIIGRKDNGEYVGVQDVKGTTKTISDTIRNKFHFISETRAENIDGKDCIIIDVSKGIRSWIMTEGSTSVSATPLSNWRASPSRGFSWMRWGSSGWTSLAKSIPKTSPRMRSDSS